ncbi:hypothetical protein AAFF_G00156670 [Aldrovandia affinis]|uniref:Uncharacterized protein n=1 Tax=Aldrovandia affinis TaxID=143900 RepID=A0AAD7RNH5_9TELE|nr:hypothetical protein AAFF_G00156670 [Aldrovandia affinis]
MPSLRRGPETASHSGWGKPTKPPAHDADCGSHTAAGPATTTGSHFSRLLLPDGRVVSFQNGLGELEPLSRKRTPAEAATLSGRTRLFSTGPQYTNELHLVGHAIPLLQEERAVDQRRTTRPRRTRVDSAC